MPESDAATLPPPSQRPERWLGNASILIVTQLVAKVLGTVLTIVAARTLGVADYGLYMFALTFGGIFGLIAAFGLPQLITRQVARDTENTGEVLGAVLLVEAILSLAALLVMAAVLLLLDYSTQRLWIVLLAGSTMLLNAILGVITAFYRGHQRMGLEAAVRLLLSALNLGLSLAVLLAGLGIVALATVQLAVFVAVVLLAIALAARKLARPRFTGARQLYRGLLKAARPFAVASVFIFIYDGTAVIFLSLMKGDEATGLYAGAWNFVRFFGILPAGLVGAALPAMSQLWKTSPSEWHVVYRRTLKYLLIMGLPIAIGLSLVSRDLVVLVLGDAYAGAAPVLSLGAWLILVEFLNHGFTNALISTDREATFLRIIGLALAFNLLANLFLVGRWGAIGAAGASLLTEILILIVQVYVLSITLMAPQAARTGSRKSPETWSGDFRPQRFAKIRSIVFPGPGRSINGVVPDLVSTLFKPMLAAAAMGAVVLAMNSTEARSLVATVAVAVVVYGVALLVLRVFEPDEIDQARALVGRFLAECRSIAKRTYRLGARAARSQGLQ